MSGSPDDKGRKARGIFADVFAEMLGDDPLGAAAAEIFDETELAAVLGGQARAYAETGATPYPASPIKRRHRASAAEMEMRVVSSSFA